MRRVSSTAAAGGSTAGSVSAASSLMMVTSARMMMGGSGMPSRMGGMGGMSGMGGGMGMGQQFKRADPFATTVTTSNTDQPAQPTIPAPIHPDFDLAMSKEVRKSFSFPHKKGAAAAAVDGDGKPYSKDRYNVEVTSAMIEQMEREDREKAAQQRKEKDENIVKGDFDVEPPMMKNSGLTAGASAREDASQGVASAIANIFETEQRHEELRKTTTRIIDKRRLVVDKQTGEVLTRRSEEEVAAEAAKSTHKPVDSPEAAAAKKKRGFFNSIFGGKKDKAEKQKEADRVKGLTSSGVKFTTNIEDDEDATIISSSSSNTGDANANAASAAKGKKYRFFEDQYPKEAPKEAAAKRYAYYEEMEAAAKVKCQEDKGPGLTESERLHVAHDWKEDREGITPSDKYGWAEEWGPEPGEEGHSEWYKKHRMYMSYEEKSRLDLKNGVPLEKNQFRHHEMPVAKKMKSAYERLSDERGGPQMFGMNERDYDASHTYEEKKDFLMVARDDYMKEWLAKPGVTPENMAKNIGDYNGTAKKQTVKAVQRKPEWEIAPLPEHD